MSDFKDLGFEEDKFHDLGFEEGPKESPSISKAQSALKGAEQGLTFGLADEGAGLIGLGLDKAQALAHNLGLSAASPSQVNEELKQKGVSGNLPSSSGDIYEEARNAARNEYAQAQEANPGSFLAGDIAGSIVAPAANLAKAGLGAKAVVGGGLGALQGFGRSEDEGTDLAKDTAIGAGLGAAIPAIGEGVSTVAKAAIPDSVKNAFQKGISGINTNTPEFVSNTFNKMRSTSKELSDVLTNKQQALNEEVNVAKKAAQSTLDKSKKIADDKLSDIENSTQKYLEQLKQSQIENNDATKKSLEKSSVKIAKNLQNDLESVRKNLGSQYDKIDAMSKDAGVQVDAKPVLSEFIDSLQGTDLTQNQINAIVKKFEPENGLIDFQQFQDLKRKMYELSSPSESPRLRFLAKKAYGNLGSSYEETLRNNGLHEIADKLTDTNKKWSVYSNMDSFIEGVAPDRITKETYASPTTIKTIKSLASDKAEDIAKNEQFKQYNNLLFPQDNLQEAKSLSEQLKQASNFTPSIPDKQTVLSTNPQYKKYQEMMDLIKGSKAKELSIDNPELNKVLDTVSQTQGPEAAAALKSSISKMEPSEQLQTIKQFGNNPESIDSKILSMIPQSAQKSSNPRTQKEYQDLFNILNKEKGSDFATKAQDKLKELGSDYDLGTMINEKNKIVPHSLTDLASSAAKLVSGNAAKMSNKVGRSISDYKDMLEVLNKANSQKAINSGASILDKNHETTKKINSASPEQLKQTAQVIKQQNNPAAAKLAHTLETASESDIQKKNALTFSAMQDPNNREMLRNVNKSEDEE